MKPYDVRKLGYVTAAAEIVRRLEGRAPLEGLEDPRCGRALIAALEVASARHGFPFAAHRAALADVLSTNAGRTAARTLLRMLVMHVLSAEDDAAAAESTLLEIIDAVERARV
jgi:hypothetical protein